MGEAAENILNGSCCQECGEWFEDILDGEEPPGFPRSCQTCSGFDDGLGEFDED